MGSRTAAPPAVRGAAAMRSQHSLLSPVERALDSLEHTRQSDALGAHLTPELRPLAALVLALAKLAGEQDAAERALAAAQELIP